VRSVKDILRIRHALIITKKPCKYHKKTVCERKRNCGTCGNLITSKKHECNKRYCQNCVENKEVGHLCYMRPLRNALPASDGVFFIFYDFETTKHTRYSEKATVHVPNLVFVQQFCSKCENVEDIEQHCVWYGKIKHSFWKDPVRT